MSDNVVHLPRPRGSRPESTRFGLYLHVGRDQHKDLLDVLAEGIQDFSGIIIAAPYASRHRELIADAVRRNLDVILDPQTLRSATIGGHTKSLGELPWGLERPHRLADFGSIQGRKIAGEIAEFAKSWGMTQTLGPTHFLQGPNDPWLRTDVTMMGYTREALDRIGCEASLVYSLALPMEILRDSVQRRAIIAAVADAPFDGLWLRIGNFGSDASGQKTAAYIQACVEFQELNVPIVADQVGGLPALGLLAFGAVGGLAHGVTMLEGYKPAAMQRPRSPNQNGAMPTRVYVPRLDSHLKPEEAATFLKTSSRVASRFGCRDTHCCPRGIPDMLQHPVRHFVGQRSRQVRELSAVPVEVRTSYYLDEHVRRVSDDVAAAAGYKSLSPDLKRKLVERQKKAGRFRGAMAYLATNNPIKQPAMLPLDRLARDRK